MTPCRRSLLLIHPPVAKPCEPPLGIARLAGALHHHGADVRVYDANREGLFGLLNTPLSASDTWTRRALSHRQGHMDALCSAAGYRHPDIYRRAVMDLNRILAMAGKAAGVNLSFSNYTDNALSPVRSRDLIQAAETFSANPFFPFFSTDLSALFTAWTPDGVGLSINFMSQALCAFAIIGWVRKMLPRVRIICGGGLVTSWTRIPGLGNPFSGLVDELVGGPGETPLLSFCQGASNGNGSAAFPPADDDFTGLSPDHYLSPVPVLPVSASRGCYWRKCAFCPETAEKTVYVPTAPDGVSRSVNHLARKTNAGLIHFLDNALSPKLLAYLADHPPQASWYGFSRITRHLANPEFARRLKQAGCVMLKLGVESGDQAVLDAMNKGAELETMQAALRALHQAGIATYVYLLFGTPAEDESSARKTLEFTLSQAPFIDFLNLAIFNLPAGSPATERLETGAFYEGDLSLYREFVHPKGWQRDQVRRFLSREFKKPAAIREILHRDPPYFTSNHAPFLMR
ncbi:radical SAM protein [Desulfosarcina sp. OttesenSCG-928-A07]|nr:radical SAM protein [Desulfosarcina sp. OttesenSCG-928-G17]MDL2328408.1 radical SAM protein [Desulfosarcina sp. OttesenSCG-928-A07]